MIPNRDYFSWSQYSTYLASKTQFHKRYVLNEPSLPNKYFVKGKLFGEAMDTGIVPEWNKDDMLPLLIQSVPKLDIMEDKIEYMIGPEDAQVKMLTYLDSSVYDYKLFLEYKTGKIPWTQELVDNHDQLLVYALGIYVKSNRKIVPKCKLIWVQTVETKNEETGNDELWFTGKYESFDREFTITELEYFEKQLYNTYIDILQFEYNNIETKHAKKYAKLALKVKEYQKEMDDIKALVMVEMELGDAIKASSKHGSFSLVKGRKSYVFSDDLIKKDKEYKSEILKLKNKEKKDNVAKITLGSSYVSFKASKSD